MHAATLSASKRLQVVLAFLRDRGERGATTREIIDATGVCAVNSVAAELREQGVPILCAFERTTESGARIYRYTIMQPGQQRLPGMAVPA